MEEILNEKRGEYYMDVREFKNGTLEVVVKAIRPMHEAAIYSSADPLSYANCCKAMGESASTYTGPRFIRHDDEEISVYKKSENHNRAVRRAKQNIRWLVKEMNGDRLLTLTYRKNQQDREEVKAHFKRFIRLVRNGWKGQEGYPDWQYVAVLEQQDRGAYHIHCAVTGWQRISFIRKAWYKAIGGQGNETGEGTPGQVDVTSPKATRWGTKAREWRSSKLAAYLTKYLAKTFEEDSDEKKRYWHSKDSSAPKKQRFILSAFDVVAAIKEVCGVLYFHFGRAIDFRYSWMSGKDCLWLSLEGGA